MTFFERDKFPDMPLILVFLPRNPQNFRNAAVSGYGKEHEAVFEKSGVSFEMFKKS